MARRPTIAATTSEPRPKTRVVPSLKPDASPEAHAEAMVRCLCYAPSCGDAGECQLEGYCFTIAARGLAQAKRAMKALVEYQKDPSVRTWIQFAADSIERMDFQKRSLVDVRRMVLAHQKFREENAHLLKKGDD